MKYDTATPYAASYVILRDGNKVAFVLRQNTNWMDDFYGLPSGKVEKGEPFTLAAIREAKEEAGINISPEHLQHAVTIHRHSTDSDWVDAYFEVTKWSGEVHNAEPDVHAELAWLDLDNLPENVIPGVRFALDCVKKGLKFAEDSWD